MNAARRITIWKTRILKGGELFRCHLKKPANATLVVYNHVHTECVCICSTRGILLHKCLHVSPNLDALLQFGWRKYMQASFTPISPHMTRKRGPLNRILQNSGCWTEYIFFVMKTNREDQKDWSGCGVLSFLSSAIHPGNPFFVYLVSISQWYQFPCPATSPIRLWSPCLPIHTQTHTHVHVHVHANTHTHTHSHTHNSSIIRNVMCVYMCVCVYMHLDAHACSTRAHTSTHIPSSHGTYEWVTSHIWMSHVTHIWGIPVKSSRSSMPTNPSIANRPVWHDSFIYMIWLPVWHDWFIYVTRLMTTKSWVISHSHITYISHVTW